MYRGILFHEREIIDIYSRSTHIIVQLIITNPNPISRLTDLSFSLPDTTNSFNKVKLISPTPFVNSNYKSHSKYNVTKL